MKRFLLSLISAILIFSTVACSSATGGADAQGSTDATNAPVTEEFEVSAADMFSNRDLEGTYSENGAVKITLEGASASSNSPKAKIEGSTVTLDSEGTYIFSGTLDDGSIVVDAADTAKLQIVLDGAKIKSSSSAALLVRGGDKVFVTLADGSENVLENGGRFPIDDEGIDGAVFSREDITFNGNGKLSIISPEGHGIVTKDDLVFVSGTYEITAASHGADANDSIRIKDAEISVTAGKDGLHAENNDDPSLGFIYAAGGELTVESEGDGISAGAYMQIDGGDFSIATVGTDDSASMKGLKAVSGILLNGGAFKIDSAEDAIHSDTTLTVNGGTFDISSEDDALHADATVTVTDGDVKITKSYEGIEAEDINVLGGNIEINATDDGINSAGGTDDSGNENDRDAVMPNGGRPTAPGGHGGGPGGPGGPGGNGGMPVGDGSVVIFGGNISITARGDGIDVNGRFEVTGGNITVTGPSHGDTATLDFYTEGIINGGAFFGTGGSMMAQTFTDSSQGVISLRVGDQKAGTQITVADSDGNVIISGTPSLDFAVVIISTPDLVKGETYSVTVGTESAEIKAN